MMKSGLKTLLLAGGALLFSVALTSCKGRTLDDVEPTGETIEVQIEEQTDSAPTQLPPQVVEALESGMQKAGVSAASASEEPASPADTLSLPPR